jgi:hypothetical protein
MIYDGPMINAGRERYIYIGIRMHNKTGGGRQESKKVKSGKQASRGSEGDGGQ